MNQYIMKGGNPLVGEVQISGAKNAALGILAASIMTDENVVIENLPDVRDINVMLEAIEEIGARVLNKKWGLICICSIWQWASLSSSFWWSSSFSDSDFSRIFRKEKKSVVT